MSTFNFVSTFVYFEDYHRLYKYEETLASAGTDPCGLTFGGGSVSIDNSLTEFNQPRSGFGYIQSKVSCSCSQSPCDPPNDCTAWLEVKIHAPCSVYTWNITLPKPLALNGAPGLKLKPRNLLWPFTHLTVHKGIPPISYASDCGCAALDPSDPDQEYKYCTDQKTTGLFPPTIVEQNVVYVPGGNIRVICGFAKDYNNQGGGNPIGRIMDALMNGDTTDLDIRQDSLLNIPGIKNYGFFSLDLSQFLDSELSLGPGNEYFTVFIAVMHELFFGIANNKYNVANSWKQFVCPIDGNWACNNCSYDPQYGSQPACITRRHVVSSIEGYYQVFLSDPTGTKAKLLEH